MKGSRRRSRELALQGLYQWLINRVSADEVMAQLSEQEDFGKADQAYLAVLVHGVTDNADALRTNVEPLLDRPMGQLSPVEHALLLMAASELVAQAETPYRVVINEAVELAKRYGGTDGHKYVNGVLDKLAAKLRPHEVAGTKRT